MEIFGGCGLCGRGAPGLGMGPCMVEIDRIVIVEKEKASSIIILVSTTIGPCLLALIVMVACMCLKRKHEGHRDNSYHYDVIPDDITEQEATPYTSLQMTERHLYTALAVRLENTDDEPDNDSPIETNYAYVEVPDNGRPGQTYTDSEAKVVFCCC
ncbi:hypothetical protein DPMN_077776 [Dreissena polymorpha]|uniref:Uncharacterized protein n=1 Tax=Dreissena polymorpha TaxID=45954 RepID=A0A9D4BGX9_DREPO|nr:hypothetical protein DPMN_077776 [Dreissena polymorpha]